MTTIPEELKQAIEKTLLSNNMKAITPQVLKYVENKLTGSGDLEDDMTDIIDSMVNEE